MNEIYYRVSYKDIGVYEAFKKELWKKSETPKKEWDNLKSSDVFLWLKAPEINYENCYSYFTELGYELFKINTYPTFLKYLDKKEIKIDKYSFKGLQLDVLYEDEYQIVVKN